MHLMGDLHQPLHAASLVTKEKPGGDGLGGNYIVRDRRAKNGGRRITLHVFWDALPGNGDGYRPIEKLADELRTQKVKSFPEYRDHTTIPAWVQESFRAAVNFAYAENRVRYAHVDDLKKGTISESEIPTLSPDYITEARAIAQRRLALAGQRLADELKKVW
jgi:hypothetical protein